jgi:hypothetical protein
MQDHGDSELSNLLELALQNPSQREWSWNSVSQQSAIGWHHLYRGRIAKGMIEHMEHHYRKLQLDSKRYTGERWGKKLLQNIWDGVLKLWQQRNEMIHDTTNKPAGISTTTRQRLASRMAKYYEYSKILGIEDREIIFNEDLQTLLEKDDRYLKAWLKMAQRVIRRVKLERQKTSNSRKIMENFVSWKPATQPRKRRYTPTRSPADLHPD